MHIAARRKFKVKLAPHEKQFIKTLTGKGIVKARVITRSRILLLADEQKTDAIICEALGLTRSVVYDTRKHYVTGGLDRALYDLPHPGKERTFTGEQEAEIIALACSETPQGSVRWTMDLLTKEVRKKLGISIGRTTVYKILLRSNTKPWLKKMWCIPFMTPEYKTRMLDVLEVYERPYNPRFPVVCLDEKNKQLLRDARATLRVRKGKPERADYEYERNGICNLFVAVEPKAGKRTVRVTRRRRKQEYASFIKHLALTVYKKAKKIVLVEDNLNTHDEKVLIEVFGEREGRKIAKKIEWHFTPKHASWLDQAEIEIHALEQQCLNRRIGEFQTMQKEVTACVRRRNQDRCQINWQFTREKATVKFRLS